MGNRLPKRLSNEPLVDAIFEIRFISDFPTSELLPGVLFNQLEGEKCILLLPPSQIPSLVRKADTTLQFAPINRLDWNHFFINCGDKSLSIGCKLPYPGWLIFKNGIVGIMEKIAALGIIKAISRYAIKYIDLIPLAGIDEPISLLNIEFSLANQKFSKEPFHVRVEIPKNEYINIVQLVSSATVAASDGTNKQGIVVDVDTIKNVDNISVQELMENLSSTLDEIHLTNKTIFFDCLKPSTIEDLGAEYED